MDRVSKGKLKSLCTDFANFYQNTIVKNRVSRAKLILSGMSTEGEKPFNLELKAWSQAQTDEDIYAHDFRYFPTDIKLRLKSGYKLDKEDIEYLRSRIKIFSDGEKFFIKEGVSIDVSMSETFAKAKEIINFAQQWVNQQEALLTSPRKL